MAKLTQEMKDMISTQQCFVGTVSKEGIPNVAPKRSTRVLNDETLIFNEVTGGATYKNLLDGSKVSIAVVNREVLDGYRFVGSVEVQDSGDLYEQAATMAEKNNIRKPLAVVLVHIDEIHSLKPGMAGQKIS
jgi:predicted pyridoxine 5'-phosphate oxidase superfamily flavin-nucleotide-binding protein